MAGYKNRPSLYGEQRPIAINWSSTFGIKALVHFQANIFAAIIITNINAVSTITVFATLANISLSPFCIIMNFLPFERSTFILTQQNFQELIWIIKRDLIV